MNINCFIIDDEEHAIDLLAHHIQKVSFLNLVGTCTDPVTALSQLRTSTIDLLFLDVQMPHLTGMELLKILDRGNTKIILTTAYTDYALEGYEFEVVDYLLKPISFNRFMKAIDKMAENNIAQENKPDQKDPYIFVKSDRKGKLLKIDINEIIFVEGLKNYIVIHTKAGKEIVVFLNMKDLEDHLDTGDFIRTHKSYIVSLRHISSIDGNQIKVAYYPQRSIPIGNVYKEAFQQLINKNLLSR